MPNTVASTPLRRRLTCCIALLCSGLLTGACSTQTITLSRQVPGEIDTAHMSSMLLAPLNGEASTDAMHLMRHSLGALAPFELLHNPKNAALIDLDQVIAWAKDSQADGALTASLEVGTLDAATGRAVVTGYIAVADVATGRTLLFEPVEHAYQSDDTMPQEELRLAALQDFVHTFAHRMMPHQEGADVMLYADRALPDSTGAITALIAGDWRTATSIYRTAVDNMNTWTTPAWLQARVHYNLGTTLGFGGSYAEGLEQLRLAQRLAPCATFEAQIARLEAYRVLPKKGGSGHRLWRCHRALDFTPTCVHPFEP